MAVTKLETPDEKFMACCLDRQLPDACLSKCSFSTYNRNALQVRYVQIWITIFDLQNMYFRVDSCPMQAVSLFCKRRFKNIVLKSIYNQF